MNSSKKYIRLAPSEKILLIERYLNGEKISKICAESSISRTIFYRWLKESKKNNSDDVFQALAPKNPKGRKHWRRLKITKEHDVIKLWKNNPDLSIRKIAESAQVSIGGAWNIVKKYRNDLNLSGKKIKRYVKNKYKIFTVNEKIELIHRYQLGESIAKITRNAGISRTVFYKWLRLYESSKNIDLSLQKRHPSQEKHWRFMPRVQDLAIEIIVENPSLSLSQIAIRIRNEGETISKSGLYYVLKRLNLTNYDDRLAYISSINTYEPERLEFVEKKYDFTLKISSILPQFAVYTLFLLLISTIFFASLNPTDKVDTGNTIGTKIENEQPEGSGENDSKPRNKPNSATNMAPALGGAQQVFRWGALAINSPQSSYSVGEGIEMGFGVVDHAGNTICDAELSVLIIDSRGQMVFESGAETKSIQPSGDCTLQSVTNTPDYSINVPGIQEEGEYEMRITAITYEGVRDFSHKLIIENDNEIEITRSSYPLRIFPVASYPVEINIKARKDFLGVIEENLPEGIKATMISRGGILFKNDQGRDHKIKWNVDLKKGDTYKISYSLHFPQIWPEFYEIGPMKFISKMTGKVVFQEERFWQVVADAL